jgi:hypothetical protein
MFSNTKICKVCGAEYKACQATRLVEGVFRWKDVACCPEHGQEYFRQVMIARGLLEEIESAAVPAAKIDEPEVVEDLIVETSPEDQEIDEEDFDDEFADEDEE